MDLRENLLWLLNIPSPSGQEGALSDAIQQRLAALQLPSPMRRHGDSLVVTLSANTGGPKLLFSGHLDVAAVVANASPRVDGNRVIGPGASDSKSGLALMLDLAEHPITSGVDLSLVFSARGALGYHEHELASVLKEEPELARRDLVLVVEPTDNRLELGSGGTTHATFRFPGQSSHSGQPGARANAILRALPWLNRLAALEPVEDEVDGLIWYELFTVTHAEGGRPGTFVPSEFDLNLHHHYGPSSNPELSQDKLLALAEGHAIVRFEELAPSAAPIKDHALAQALRDAGAVGVGAHQACSDVARFAELGAPAVNFGPGSPAQSHRAGEWVDLRALETARTILETWLSRIAKPRSSSRASSQKSPQAQRVKRKRS